MTNLGSEIEQIEVQFQSLEVVYRGTETQLGAGANFTLFGTVVESLRD